MKTLLLWLACCLAFVNAAQAQVSWQWAQSFPTVNVTDVATDASGDLFVTGSFATPVAFASRYFNATLTPVGVSDIFLARFDARGNVRWARQVGGPGATARGTSIALDGAGFAYLTGEFANASLTVNTGSGPLVFVPEPGSISRGRACVLKYATATGSVRWSRSNTAVPGGRDCIPAGVAAGSNGCFVVGRFGSVTRFDTTTITGNRFGSVFVAAYSAAGNLRWLKASNRDPGGNIFAQAWATGVATDFAGNCYLTGFYQSSDFVLGGLALPPIALTAMGTGQQAVVARLNPATGNAVWLRGTMAAAGSVASASGTDVSVATGGCYVGGTMSPGTISFGSAKGLTATARQGYLARYNAGTGAIEWVRALRNARGAVLLASSLLNVVAASSVQPEQGPDSRVKVWSFWPWGAVQASLSARGGNSVCSSVAQAGSTVYVAGVYSGTVAFGDDCLPAPGNGTGFSSFLARLSPTRCERQEAEPSAVPGLAAYPNPAIDELRVELPDGTRQVALLDYSGHVVRELQAPTLETRFDVRGLKAGLYLLRCNGPAGSSSLTIEIGQ